MARNVAWVLSLIVLLLTGCLGLTNGLTEWRDAHTMLQKTVTGGVLLYGILGLVTAFGLMRRARWSLWTALAWGVVVTYVASTAAIAYAGTSATVGGAVAGGVASAFIAAGVAWAASISTRPPSTKSPTIPP